jgi:RNA-directed DNA polymerase
VSPLLANIYLHELDRYMESNYLTLTNWQKRQRRAKGKSNFLYVRYADDFIVLCNGTKAQAQDMKEELKHVLSHIGLTLSEEKTKVTHITEGFKFLGFWITRELGGRGKITPKVLIPDSAIKRFKQSVRRILDPHTTNEATTAKIDAVNRLTRGWCQYYRNTSSPSNIFGKLRPELFWEMAHWLGRKYKISMPKVMERYKGTVDSSTTLKTKTIALVMPTEYKARKLLAKTWHNPYTAKEAIVREEFLWYESLWSGQEDREGRGDLREEVILLKGTICALNMPDICESKGISLHPSEVEIDHIILRAKFKDPTEADRMGNLQPVCTPCHRAKTTTDLKVLSRMR